MPHRVSRLTPVLTQLVVTLTIVAITVGGGTIAFLYDATIKDKKQQLISLAVNAATLIDTAFDVELRVHQKDSHYKADDSIQKIIGTSRKALSKFHGIGKSGTVMIVQRYGNDFAVLMHVDRGDSSSDTLNVTSKVLTIPTGSARSKPVVAALHGNAGTMTIEDDRGRKVITAFAPIKSLGLALITETHFSEVDAPFIKAVVQALLLAALFVGLGVFFIYRQTLPLFERVIVSESRFKGFTDTATEWFWEMGRNLRFKTMGKGGRFGPNTEQNVYLGRTRQEIAANAEDVTTQKWVDHLDDMHNRRPFMDFQYDMIIEGERRTLSVSGVPIFDKKGEFLGYQGTGRDVSDLIKDKRRIEEAEERLRGAFESITIAVILINEQGTIESFNPMAGAVFGYAADEVVGQNITMLMPESERGRHTKALHAYIFGGKPKVIGTGSEVTGLRKNGEQFSMHLGVAVMMLRGERHFIGSIKDLSAEKTMEQQLRRSQKMDAIGQLTGGIAHDFNNLLGVIIGNLDLARRKLAPDDKTLKRIENSIKAAERGAKLTNRLLNFSRQAPESNEAVEVNAVLSGLRDLLQRSITSNIDIELDLLGDQCPVRINKGDFEDALINLAVNARDAMPGGGTLTIATQHTHVDSAKNPMMKNIPAGDYIEISVSDNGCGMTPDVINRIFDPFFTTKPAGEGTGLGMAMVYGFVQRSQGTITVYSEPDMGTTFKIYLPRASDAVLEDTISQKKTVPADNAIPGGNETILIVDDEVDLAETAAAILIELGYRVLVAYDAANALRIIDDRADIDMLFSDVIMPGMNGFELAEIAVQQNPSLKVLLNSGFTGDTSKTPGKSSKNFPMLRKPYSNHELATEVRWVFDTPAA